MYIKTKIQICHIEFNYRLRQIQNYSFYFAHEYNRGNKIDICGIWQKNLMESNVKF